MSSVKIKISPQRCPWSLLKIPKCSNRLFKEYSPEFQKVPEGGYSLHVRCSGCQNKIRAYAPNANFLNVIFERDLS